MGIAQGFKKGHKPTKEMIEKSRLANLGKKQSKETIEKRIKHLLGKKRGPTSLEIRAKISKSKKGCKPWNKGKKYTDEQYYKIFKCGGSQKKSQKMMGNKHPNWKGGITTLSKRIRKQLEYKEWRDYIFKRDNYICQECGSRSGNGKTIALHPHHIKSFAKFSDLRFNPYNGITLCIDCHKQVNWNEEEYEKYFQNKLLIGIYGGG